MIPSRRRMRQLVNIIHYLLSICYFQNPIAGKIAEQFRSGARDTS
jgi:hypothetical protein